MLCAPSQHQRVLGASNPRIKNQTPFELFIFPVSNSNIHTFRNIRIMSATQHAHNTSNHHQRVYTAVLFNATATFAARTVHNARYINTKISAQRERNSNISYLFLRLTLRLRRCVTLGDLGTNIVNKMGFSVLILDSRRGMRMYSTPPVLESERVHPKSKKLRSEKTRKQYYKLWVPCRSSLLLCLV